ncbi:RluA family pseudouridine synthase [Thermanaerothrix sp.]|uniref:RluA family pseudouridine synthase n=1 Tax=Thermanaerothrix sp. TaxID=2972675 RepID=UPI003C79D881
MEHIEIVYVDEDILVINKPAGILTIPDGYDPEKPFLTRLLREEFGRLWTVHRLDRDTSGVLLFARTPQAHRALNDQFEQRQVRKIYHLVTFGRLPHEEIEVNYPLMVNGDRRHRTVVDLSRGKPARTIFRHLCSLGREFSLVEAQPLSGYTHQIRAHLTSIGLQILGDKLYKPHPISERYPTFLLPTDTPDFERVALHAYAMTFFHPSQSSREITVVASYPTDFSTLIEILRCK